MRLGGRSERGEKQEARKEKSEISHRGSADVESRPARKQCGVLVGAVSLNPAKRIAMPRSFRLGACVTPRVSAGVSAAAYFAATFTSAIGTIVSKYPIIISSDVCGPHFTVLVGSGLAAFPALLS